MHPRDIDWAYLRQGLLVSALLLTGCAALWGATTSYRSRAAADLDTGQHELDRLQAERSELTQRREARRKFAALYTQLTGKGVIGNEQRLALVQATRDAGSELRLPYLRYTTSPQRPFQAAWLPPGASAPVLVSPIDLQVGLVHELDLLRLARRLREAPGLVQIQACSLDRLGTDRVPEPDKANLTASCQLALFSMPRENSVAANTPED